MANYNEKDVNELANWIDPYALARALLSTLDDSSVEPTVDNAKEAWLDMLEHNLSHCVIEAVNFSPIFAAEHPIKVCCRNCAHCDIIAKTCSEGGFTEIGNLDKPLTPEDCNAFSPTIDAINAR